MASSEQALLEESLDAAKSSIGKRLDLFYFLAKHPWLYLDRVQVDAALHFLSDLRGVDGNQDLLLNIVEARLRAFAQEGARIAVFSMPKSGSTYLSELLTMVLGVTRVNLDTSAGSNTAAGCNAREDELDELAIIQSILAHSSFVAQHHTKATASLLYSLRNYRICPIVMIRNIPDCLVSLDDMMMEWNLAESDAVTRGNIFFNTGGRLPYDYCDLSIDRRLQILLESWGRWYLEFYVSWKRAKLSELSDPLIIRYEDHVVQSDALFELLQESLGLEGPPLALLGEHLQMRVRFNKGVVGRGMALSIDQRRHLLRIADAYGEELSSSEIDYLIG